MSRSFHPRSPNPNIQSTITKKMTEMGDMAKKLAQAHSKWGSSQLETEEELDALKKGVDRMMGATAAVLLKQAGIDNNTATPFTLLDNACGMGPIASQIQATVPKEILKNSKIVCADLYENNTEVVKKIANLKKWVGVETAAADAQKSHFPDAAFSHPLPHPFPMFVNGKPEWTDVSGIEAELKAFGFRDIQIITASHAVPVHSGEDYIKLFGMMRDWVVKSYWSEESKERGRDMLDGHIVKHLNEKYGGKSWDTTWTMISVTCRKPSGV
ncbi:S-adenosyl-L-methionine-dependent methyltransferase [Xylariomycetidae sp. FL2044]|nr:S-adenosyl-L-methionine-dependent methyltransferase [Xylariomycetidae sp. FL2044]